jgi:uncharacterized protein (TIGR02421 family)
MTMATSSKFTAHDLAVDRQLAEIALGFRFLLDVTPVNTVVAREDFLAGTAEAPEFLYRPLEDDPAISRDRLAAVGSEAVDDPALGQLVRAKQRELSLQLDMLSARDSAEFRFMSIELYGAVTSGLLEQARHLLSSVDAVHGVAHRWLDAYAFAEAAERELDYYRAVDSDISAHVEIRDDCSEIMVTNGILLVPVSARVSEARTNAILAHEIGTHVLTYVNGAAQPLRLLAAGLAGYEETQEGLALIAEHLVGGLTAARLRQIAARVVAVQLMVAGATFRAVHERLCGEEFTPVSAFAITMRAFRSGGLTKDAVYLRGLAALLAHLGAGGSLDALWLGKVPLTEAHLVQSMHDGGALNEPRLRPRYLADTEPHQRLEALRSPSSVVDLVVR